jgi:hypothetical protein
MWGALSHSLTLPLTHHSHPSRGPKSAAELEAEGVKLVLQAEASGELQGRHQFLYATVDSLTVADVRVLLGQYKELVLKYEALAMVRRAREEG